MIPENIAALVARLRDIGNLGWSNPPEVVYEAADALEAAYRLPPDLAELVERLDAFISESYTHVVVSDARAAILSLQARLNEREDAAAKLRGLASKSTELDVRARKAESERDAGNAALAEAMEALAEIAKNDSIPLPKIDGESLDATAAKRLYTAGKSGIDIARTFLARHQAGETASGASSDNSASGERPR